MGLFLDQMGIMNIRSGLAVTNSGLGQSSIFSTVFDKSFQSLFRGSQSNGRHEKFDLMDKFQVPRLRCEPWIMDDTSRKSGR